MTKARRAGRPSRLAPASVALVALGLSVGIAHAQGTIGVDPTGRSGEPPPLLREEPKPPAPPTQILPPVPPPPTREPSPLFLPRVFVREIRIVGATVFSAEELARITAPYVGREVTAEDLEALRVALTLHYVNAGYVNSGAILPDQTVVGGVVTFQIVEGALTRVDVEGLQWFREGYLRDRLTLGAGPPLNINALGERLQLLQQDPRIQRILAELRPGLRPGESVLALRVEERTPYKLRFDFDNYQSPAVGSERGSVTLEHLNLLGFGDTLSVRYGRSEGVDPQIDLRYSFPVTALDTTVTFQYRKNDFFVVEEPFGPLEIKSESEVYGLTVRHPVYRTLDQTLALELTGERLTNRTFLLDEPFSFSLGPHDGESTVTAIRFAQEWVQRTQTQVLAARSRFSVGVDALGATVNSSEIPDGKFLSWLGQFQWVRRLPLWDMQVLLRGDLQLTDDPLLALEQISVGGRFTVRGYRENTLVRDNAVLASLELRLPLVRNARWAEFLELAPFVDFGRGWNVNPPPPEPMSLPSVGLGLRWAAAFTFPMPVRPQLEVYWGHPLTKVETSGKNLQDDGIHFQVSLAAF